MDHTPRPPPQEQEVTEDAAETEPGGDDGPVRRPAELLGDQDGPEHEDRRQHDGVVRPHPAEEGEHPRSAADLDPARVQTRQEVLGGRFRVLLREHPPYDTGTQRDQAGDGDEERARIEEQRSARADQGDQEPGDHLACDGPGGEAQPAQGVGGLEVTGATVPGRSPVKAGAKNASAAPYTEASTAM